ncbi:glycosyltransferase family 2 protein [Calothrix sp. FACHB-1219]|uniref:hormogonium polysaccharide biosynthesis glycosyltransferase HpsE n=1 Tax=unclassified Calothrix TaxID=2619626 RepID=UPI0016869BE8|nr:MULTISPECIES: hormogonium polysaccharide biosynthesis glycosyltransferase HpsE [unclassified Calothrix]MBD2204052.1 glycosyltransferase family 2 protein [Calothrix sp. FACHB-168]MBD2221225.1 glycosyltransferase family 2 protein [Calothrix sp. FACHB-1219]
MTDILTQKLDITVAIPTYNGAERLPKLLDLLLAQTGLENLNWEIIIVDNNSSDRTNIVIQNYQKICNSICPLRYFLETKQGAAFARIRAAQEARGEVIAFLDDDNLPALDWLIAAYNFGIEHPQAGVWSGQIHGSYEVSPPKNFERIQGFLAIREHGNQPHLFEAKNLRLPPGAALVVRKQVWCDHVPTIPILSGKLPGVFVQGDDYEPLLYIHSAGWEIWYNPTMHTYHQIPHWRLEKTYLLTLARGCGLCIFYLRTINTKSWQKPIIFFMTFLGNLYRLVKHLIKYKNSLKTDIIALFEFEFYLGSMISPFYYMKNLNIFS